MSNNYHVSIFKRIQFSSRQRQEFLEDLSVLVEDGVPPNKAIEMLGKIYDGISLEVVEMVSMAIGEGLSLADGMRAWFDTSTVELVHSGEVSGALPRTLKSASNALGKKNNMLAGIIAALIYPITVIIMGVIVIIYLRKSIFVDFMKIKPVTQWPAVGQALVSFADFLQNYWWLPIVLIIVAALFFKKITNDYTGTVRDILDKLPLFSLYRRLVAARFMSSIGLLVQNGISFKAALKVVGGDATPYLSSHVIKMERLLSQGLDNIAMVLDTSMIESGDILRLKVVAEAKGFEHGLIRLGVRAEEKGEKLIALLGKLLGGVLLAIGGGMVIFMVMGIYMVGMSLG